MHIGFFVTGVPPFAPIVQKGGTLFLEEGKRPLFSVSVDIEYRGGTDYHVEVGVGAN